MNGVPSSGLVGILSIAKVAQKGWYADSTTSGSVISIQSTSHGKMDASPGLMRHSM